MSDSAPAIEIVLAHEGGWVDDPSDRGGETNFGISMRFIKNAHLQPYDLCLTDFEPGCLKHLAKETAERIYRDYFWAPSGRNSIGSLLNQDSANKLFDAIVNMGRPAAVRCAQLAVGAMADGILGPETLTKIDLAGEHFEDLLATAMAARYAHIIDADPTQEKFRHNWMGRAACTSTRRCRCHP